MLDSMQDFQPKHYNHNCNTYTNIGVFISSDGRIVLTNTLKEFIVKKDLYVYVEELGSGDEDADEDAEYEIRPISAGYGILYEDIVISYDQLMLIDNAISVCSNNHLYLILLSNHKLIYIYCDRYAMIQRCILELKEKLNSVEVEYIDGGDALVLHANHSLYVISRSYKIVVYDNVIGHLSNTNILLILFSDYRIACISTNTLYKIDNQMKIEVDSTNILDGINFDLITEISIYYNQLCMLVDGSAHFWTTDKINRYSNDMSIHTNIKDVRCKYAFCFWLLEDNRLFFRSLNKVSYNVECCVNVARYLIIDCYLVCFHFKDSVTVIDYTTKKDEREDLNTRIPCLYAYLTNTSNLSTIKSIKTFLKYIKDTNYLFYINNDDTIEILDIVNLKLIDLSIILCIDSNIKILHLFEHADGNYI